MPFRTGTVFPHYCLKQDVLRIANGSYSWACRPASGSLLLIGRLHAGFLPPHLLLGRLRRGKQVRGASYLTCLTPSFGMQHGRLKCRFSPHKTSFSACCGFLSNGGRWERETRSSDLAPWRNPKSG